MILTRNGRRTGHVVAVQVKSGKKYKRAEGYAIPVDDHYEDWRESRVPVVGIVYDLDKDELYWINLTKSLKESSSPPAWVPVPLAGRLSNETLKGFVAQLEAFIDSEGMRVRRESTSEVFETVRQARQTRAVEQSPDSDDPNPLFEPFVDLAIRYEAVIQRFAKDAFKYLLLATLGLLMYFEWPYQVQFVVTFSDLNPMVWVLNIYFFTYFLALIVFFEFKAGRLPRFTGSYLTLVLCNFYVNPFFIGDGKDSFWGTCWIVAGVFAPSVGYKFAIVWYIRLAVNRRKRKQGVPLAGERVRL